MGDAPEGAQSALEGTRELSDEKQQVRALLLGALLMAARDPSGQAWIHFPEQVGRAARRLRGSRLDVSKRLDFQTGAMEHTLRLISPVGALYEVSIREVDGFIP